MPIQTATTGNLETISRIVLAATRFTAEHSAPCVQLVEHFTLGKGEKQITVPKAGAATAHRLEDGVDLVDSESIGISTVDLTTSEVGLKFILTDKLIRQFNEDVFRICGRLGGDAIGRIKDTDVIALFVGLNGGTELGLDAKTMTMANFAACVAYAKANKFGSPLTAVHHPNACYATAASASVTPSALAPLTSGYAVNILQDFWTGIRVSGCSLFEDGNITFKAGETSSGLGAIFNKSAMAFIESVDFNQERERDASLRAWELVMSCDYGCFELDDSLGAPMLYEILAPSSAA